MRLPALLAALLLVPALAFAADWRQVDKALSVLEGVIGHYPPEFKSEAQKRATLKRYDQTKVALDAALTTAPKDVEALLRRGRLQAMGHNMDLSGAFAGAERDFVAILDQNPQHERAILDLANMWVNASPDYAPRAEKLFRAAQCLHRDQPLEEAQRGLFFAFFYQGRIDEAKRQTEFLAARWPDQPAYREMDEAAGAALDRSGHPRQASGKPHMVSCS